MYHFDPVLALEELKEENLLPNPVHVRDMLLRAGLAPDRAMELNRQFQVYLKSFGELQRIAAEILTELNANPPR